mmetsp:Transcript_7144/g.12770  ORF Transcript_7144/g.12770 Transcript_7144/m.12770 type:complete len:994 (-) Transcript_7144:3465-6446(-)|eukprot:CAMPEP_0203749250 /NCGR_PEP_ID=MMETSP0098-20131031/3878_1 /ASSEMBLY_ACC=CAM_ASM_000208 /TAXON_ID=96639 /ORGANISM=" , Strain NY0313808BC1" /LENGTH=993 /DNA_ID=CAMNT_0050638249 /DNA_START=39 /DNA_END=3020 /DNA_ORIENTATION=-
MNEELAKKLALRRNWEKSNSNGGVVEASSNNVVDSSPGPAKTNLTKQHSRRPPPPPDRSGSARNSLRPSPPIPPQPRTRVPPPVPSNTSRNVPPPLPSPRGATKTETTHTPPPVPSPRRGNKNDSTHAPPKPPIHDNSTDNRRHSKPDRPPPPRQRRSVTGKTTREAAAEIAIGESGRRGPQDFRKPRPSSRNFTKPPVPVRRESISSKEPPPKPTRGASLRAEKQPPAAPPPHPRPAVAPPTKAIPSRQPPKHVSVQPPPVPSVIREPSNLPSSPIGGVAIPSISPTNKRVPPKIPTRRGSDASPGKLVTHASNTNLSGGIGTRPPAPVGESTRRLGTGGSRKFPSQHSENSALSAEERVELAEKGKEIFMSASNPLAEENKSKSRASSSTDHYKYCRVDEDFDPIETGYAGGPNEGFLFIQEDDVVEISSRLDENWWEGQNWDPMRGKATGPIGKFPAAYVVPIPDPYDPWEEGEEEEEEEAAVQTAKEDSEEMKKIKGWRQKNKLFYGLLELVTNEYKYVLSLQICFEIFVQPISEGFGNDYAGALFPGWQAISRTHEKILVNLAEASRGSWAKLQRIVIKGVSGSKKRDSIGPPAGLKNKRKVMIDLAAELDAVQLWHDTNILDQEALLTDEDAERFATILREWSIDVSRRLEETCDNLKVSSTYIRNYNDATRKLDRWSKTMPELQKTIVKLGGNPINKGLGLTAYLIKPVQHICRYPLLIREVHKHAVDKESQDIVLTCQIRLIEVTTEVNQMQGAAGGESSDGKMTIEELQTALRYKNDKEQSSINKILEKPTTQLVAIDELGIAESPRDYGLKLDKGTGPALSTYICFLLNCVMIITELTKNIIGKNRYKVKVIIHLERVGVVGAIQSKSNQFGMSVISNDDPNPYKGAVLQKRKKWIFTTNKSQSRDDWVQDIQQALSISRGVESSSSSKPAPSNTEREDKLKYGSLKSKHNQLQEAHPSFLLQLQNEDPLINELRRKLQNKQK